MKIISEALRFGARIDIAGSEAYRQRYGDALLTVVGGGRGSALTSQQVSGGIFMPLRGKLQVTTGEGSFVLEPGQLFLSEPDQRIQGSGRGAALWIAILAPASGWRRALRRASGMIAPEPNLVPAWHEAPTSLRRLAVRLVRAALSHASEDAALAVCDDFLSALLELQRDFDSLIGRCPGRTYSQRHSVFLRLQRVRNHMAASCHQELDVPELARRASYSPWHFIRAFHAVYGETPHAYLVKQRLERARRLVRSSPLAISEIALAIGFENRCAFSRLFKQRFGISAAELRREHGVTPRRANSRGVRCEVRELPVRAVSATRFANSGQLAAATDF
ncbi:MAG: helix-turn-helix transcriptional regulator [Tahibacter sp.]